MIIRTQGLRKTFIFRKLPCVLLVYLFIISSCTIIIASSSSDSSYSGDFLAFNSVIIGPNVMLQPFFSPNNSLSSLKALIDSAQQSVNVQVQYIVKFNSSAEAQWDNDPNPLMQSLINATQRGVQVRVILEGGADDDNATQYLVSHGVSVRHLDSGLKWNHNKGVIVDGYITSVSSVNWSKQSLTINREAGITIFEESAATAFVAKHFGAIFQYDWDNGRIVPSNAAEAAAAAAAAAIAPSAVATTTTATTTTRTTDGDDDDEVPTSSMFSSSLIRGTFNVTGFSNPDSAYELVLSALRGTTINPQRSVYAEMYSVSSSDIVSALIALKNKNKVDIKVILSRTRASSFENQYTNQYAAQLVAAGIEVYKSSSALGFTHAKFWVLDGKHTFIYSGNWAGSSITAPTTAHSAANREWGILVNDDPRVACAYESVFAADLAISEVWSSNVTRTPTMTSDDCASNTTTDEDYFSNVEPPATSSGEDGESSGKDMSRASSSVASMSNFEFCALLLFVIIVNYFFWLSTDYTHEQ